MRAMVLSMAAICGVSGICAGDVIADTVQDGLGDLPRQPLLDPVGFLHQFWPEAWNLPFLPNSSSLVLVAVGDANPNLYDVLVLQGDETDFAAVLPRGNILFDEILIFPGMTYSHEELDGFGVSSFEGGVAHGLLVTDTGYAKIVYGYLFRIGVASQITYETFVPLGEAPTSSDASSAILLFADPFFPFPEDTLPIGNGTQSTQQCVDAYESCIDDAKDTAIQEALDDGGVALLALGACGAGCLAAGPGWPACMGLCGGAVFLGHAMFQASNALGFHSDMEDCLDALCQCDGIFCE